MRVKKINIISIVKSEKKSFLTMIKASKSSSVKLTPENAKLSKGHSLRTYPVVSTSTISRGI